MENLRINELDTFLRPQLIGLWRDHFNRPPPKHLSAPVIRNILAFEIQAAEEGGLPPGFLKRLNKMVVEPKSNGPKQLLSPGARLVREWGGKTHVVDIGEHEYVWEGRSYKSLSAIAQAITGAHWSGPRFFGLKSQSA